MELQRVVHYLQSPLFHMLVVMVKKWLTPTACSLVLGFCLTQGSKDRKLIWTLNFSPFRNNHESAISIFLTGTDTVRITFI